MLPAYAGMIRDFVGLVFLPCGAPRVCGDDPTKEGHAIPKRECSPRMRG